MEQCYYCLIGYIIKPYVKCPAYNSFQTIAFKRNWNWAIWLQLLWNPYVLAIIYIWSKYTYACILHFKLVFDNVSRCMQLFFKTSYASSLGWMSFFWLNSVDQLCVSDSNLWYRSKKVYLLLLIVMLCVFSYFIPRSFILSFCFKKIDE